MQSQMLQNLVLNSSLKNNRGTSVSPWKKNKMKFACGSNASLVRNERRGAYFISLRVALSSRGAKQGLIADNHSPAYEY